MIKQILCFRRKPSVSASEFRDYWNGEFNRFIRNTGIRLGCRRLAISLTLQIEENLKLQQRQQFEDSYDGVVEFWFDNPRAAFELTSSPEWESTVTALTQDEHFALDMSRSANFFVDEAILIEHS